MKRVLLVLVVIFSSGLLTAQKEVNSYKYVIVPKKYDFLKSENAYQVNALTKFLFEKNGFSTVMQGESFPDDLKRNGCLALHADVKKNSGLFTTKLVVELKDCNANVLFTSKVGESREKEFKTAYHEALRDAFTSVAQLQYTYTPINTPVEDNVVIVSSGMVPSNTEDAIEVNAIEKNPNVPTAEAKYTFNAKIYILKKQSYGYSIEEKKADSSAFVGKVYQTSVSNSYMVQAASLSGHAFFDAEGNFILERIIEGSDFLSKDTFSKLEN